MVNTVQHKRGTTAQVNSYTGNVGEFIYNTTTKRIHTQDGVTAGGFPHALVSDVNLKANASVTISSGTGLTGGGTLAANRTIALSSASIASLALADTAVQSVNGKTGSSVTLTKADVGLSNVDNTSDANKPISTATQTALNAKANSAVTITAGSGLTGGGNLTANRTVSLDAASLASLAKADTALQAPGGAAGQVLAKNSAADNDVAWVTSEAATAVSYAPQTLTTAQQVQARQNIQADHSYDTIAIATAASVPAYTNAIRTNGYYAAGDGGAALYKRVSTEPTHAGKLQSADGSWWELSSDPISPKMFGAKLDGITNDTQALSDAYDFAELKNISITEIQGNISPNTNGKWESHNEHTPPSMNTPLRLGSRIGSKNSPDPLSGGNPMFWFEKWTSKNQLDPYSHNTEGGIIEVNYTGSGSSSEQIQATPIGFISSVTTHGKNVGTESNPSYDFRGSPIGLCGFAEAKKSPGPGNIITAMWAYATTPTMTQAEFDACTDAFYTVGLEVNIMQNMPAEPAFGVKKTVGVLLMNYRWADDVKDWTNGVLLDGSGIKGNNLSNDVTEWNGFRVGIQMDKIKQYGIRFGYLMAKEAVGISFPDDYSTMAERPTIALDTGDLGILMNEYKGSDFPTHLFWQNAGRLYFKQSDGWGAEFMLARGTVAAVNTAVTTKIPVQINGVTYYVHASTDA